MSDAREPSLVDENAERFKALGHPIRLSILRLIVQGPQVGTPAGEIQEHVGTPASTLSHHLSCLTETGLVQVEREGNFLRYRADFRTLHALTEYLWKDCCSGGIKGASLQVRSKACCGVKVRPPAKA
jgi:DNA-binding transcriptional ArsR family regulator